MPRKLRIGFSRNYLVALQPGSYSVAGQAVALSRSFRLIAEQGSYAMTGRPVTLATDASGPDPSTGLEPYMIDAKATLTGARRFMYRRGLTLAWANDNGDWLDRYGNQQGVTPWHSFTVTLAEPLGYKSVNVFDIVDHWRDTGLNKGFFVFCPSLNSSSAWNVWSGTGSPNPPKLDIVTSTGPTTLTGDLGCWADTSSSATDATLTASIRRTQRGVLHFPGLDDITGTLVSATLRLYVESKDDVFDLTVYLYEIDATPLYIGNGGKPVVMGLAAEVGEENLPSHPSVYGAGDFRRTNLWNPTLDATTSHVATTANNPAGLFNHASSWRSNRDAAQFTADPEVPGTTYYRGAFTLPGDGFGADGLGQGELGLRCGSKPNMSDPFRPAIATTEMFARVYVYFEDDYYSQVGGFKMGLGWDCRMGAWNDSSQTWLNASGSGQTPGNGKKFKFFRTAANPIASAFENDIWQAGPGFANTYRLTGGAWVQDGKYRDIVDKLPLETVRWCYEGHSMRMHSGNECGRLDDNKYPKVIALNNAPSHLGYPIGTPGATTVFQGRAYETTWDGAIFGTEQGLRIGTGPHSKFGHNFVTGRWFCVETQIKMNTINLSSPDHYGNGSPNNDGILRYWIDGAMVGERTDMAFRCHPEIGIEGPWWVIYHGGTIPATLRSHYRMNHFVCASEYIGPHPSRPIIGTYPPGVADTSDPPTTDGSLTTFASTIGLSGAPANSWINTDIVPGASWAVRSMVPGARDATQAEVEPGPSDVGNFSALAYDTLLNSNGAAWFPTKKQFFFRGGGHGGWPGSETYWVDVPSMTWGRLDDPTAMERWPEGPSGYGWKNTDGSPVSYHTYNGIVAVESQNCFYSLFGSPWPDGNFPNDGLWRFSLDTKAWTLMQAEAFAPINGHRGPEAHWIASQNKIAIGMPNYWRWYDPFTNTLGSIPSSASTLSNGNSVATNLGIYAFGSNGACFYVPFANIGISNPTAITVATHPRICGHARWLDAAHQWNSFLWDASRSMVIAWSGSYTSEPTRGGTNSLANAIIRNCGKYVYAIDFANDHLYEFVATGTHAYSEALGSFTKWQHLTSLDCYIGLNNRANSNGWMVFKPGSMTLLA